VTVRDVVEQLTETTRRLDVMIRDFKSFAREQRLDLSTVDLPDFLEQALGRGGPKHSTAASPSAASSAPRYGRSRRMPTSCVESSTTF
jgi:hypothetical protein